MEPTVEQLQTFFNVATACSVVMVILLSLVWRNFGGGAGRRRRSGFALQQAPRLSVDRLGVTADVARRAGMAPRYVASYYHRRTRP